MLFALVNGEKLEAKPNLKGVCPLCSQTVFSKCGEINIWHWAHQKDEGCDSWYEPETQWHKNWKLIFGKDHSEIVISKDGVRHIADVQTSENVIIELQNSPIQKPIIRKRETFYGERMIWIINGKHFKENFSIRPYRLSHEEYYLVFNPSSRYYGNESKVVPKSTLGFDWSRPRKSWNEVIRIVFIDFGDDKLFWVKKGMGTNTGKGGYVSKEEFVKKYGGDLDLLTTLIDFN